MTSNNPQRREFFRLKFNSPLNFKSYDSRHSASSETQPKKIQTGVSQNISQTGILFQTQQTPPKISSIVWMSLDLRTLKICQEIEARALILNNGVLGRVVRVEEDPANSSAYDVGVVFLKNSENDNRVVREIAQELSDN